MAEVAGVADMAGGVDAAGTVGTGGAPDNASQRVASLAARPRSGRALPVRVRITAVAALIMALFVFGGSFLFLGALRRAQLNQMTDAALARTRQVVASVQAGRATGRLNAERDSAMFVQVVDSGGHVRASSTNVGDMQAFVDYRRVRPIVGRTVRSEATVDGAATRLWTTGVEVDGKVYAVYVAAPLRTTRHTLALLRSELLRTAPLVFVVAVAALWLVVGRALRPVEELRREVESISPRDLHRRVSAPEVDDEVGRLARTMNDLLARLEASSDRQSRFVSDASHELRSPLAFVRTRLEVAVRLGERTDWPSTAEDVLRESRRMERLVADLLMLARSDGRRELSNPREVDLEEGIMDEVRALRAVRGVPGVTIDARGVSAGRVLGDADLLRRVVANLLDNAQRYAAATVRVTLATIDGRVELRVSDDGPGVPESQRADIFERFARPDEARARGTGGAGLGLAIANEIVQLHGGTLSIADPATATGGLGGAEFVVSIPAAGRATDDPGR